MNHAEYLGMLSLADTIRRSAADDSTLINDLPSDISDVVKGINITLFKVQYLENIHTLNQWLSRVGDFLSSQVSRPNQIDRDFYYAIMYAEVVNADDMASQIKKSFMNMDEVTRGRFINFYHDFSYFWGELDITDKPQGAIRERITILKENRSDLVWLYERLSDYRSKRVLSNMLLNWLTFDVGLITGMKENTFPDYFDPDIFAFNEDEVIVDLGAYIGDTALEYIDQIGRYKKIYCYEITGESVDKMKRKLKLYKNIEIRQKGAAQKAGVMHVSKSDIRSTSNRLAESAGDDIEVVALDEDIQERITFLKMDIEGAEQSAVLGSREHILKDRPKLAISVYHSNRDIIEIPKLISSIRDDYRYYLRSHGNQWAPSEITLFGA